MTAHNWTPTNTTTNTPPPGYTNPYLNKGTTPFPGWLCLRCGTPTIRPDWHNTWHHTWTT